MNREILLPWSCETNHKIKTAMKWLFLLTSPFGLYYTYIHINDTVVFPAFWSMFAVFVIGVSSLLSWIMQLMLWWADDKLPYFSCKTKGNGDKS